MGMRRYKRHSKTSAVGCIEIGILLFIMIIGVLLLVQAKLQGVW